MTIPAIAPGEIADSTLAARSLEPGTGPKLGATAELMQPNTEKLFEKDGLTAAQAQVGPLDSQKLSKKEVSQPDARQTPHTPHAEQDDIPEQSLLCTVEASEPESMKDDFIEKAELLQRTAAGVLGAA
jgi:hypothetical protein